MTSLSLTKLVLPFVFAVAAVAPAFAQGASVKLFKIVTVKDEIVIGLAEGEIAPAGALDAAKVASTLKAKGELGVWRYAVKKAADGALQQAPLHKIGLMAHDTLRVEPYATPLAILPPQ